MVLFGTGFEGEKFYSFNKEKIDFVIDNRRREDFHGLKCYSLEEGKDLITDYFVVVAAGDEAYDEKNH